MKKILSIVLVIAVMLSCVSISALANTGNSKITNALANMLDKVSDEEKIETCIWLVFKFDRELVERETFKECGLTGGNVNTLEEVDLYKKTYNRILGELESAGNMALIEKTGVGSEDVVFCGTISPLVILKLTKEQIYEISDYKEVEFLDYDPSVLSDEPWQGIDEKEELLDTTEPVTEKPSDSAENEKISDETAKKIAENSESLLPVYIFLQVDFNKSEVEQYVLDNVEGAKTDADIFLKYYRAEVKNIISPQVQKFVDDNKDYIENIRFQSDSTGLVIADVYAYNIEKIAQHDRVTQISYYDDVPVGNDIEWLYEDKFLEQYNINKEKLIPGEYSYSELYYHTNDKEEIDWVLVDAFYGEQCDAETYVIIGDVYGREIYSGCIFSPFETRYGVYDVKEGKFYDIKDYQNVFGRMYELIQVLEELNIGGRVNIEPPEPTATNPEVTEPNTAAPIITEPINTDPIVTEPVTLPISTDSVVTTPDATQPVVTEPVATNPVVTEPSQPASSKPVVSPKKGNPIKVSAKTKSIKAKKLKKKKQTVKPLAIKDAQGTISVTKVKNGTNKKIFKNITVNRKTGAITFKKGKYAKKTYKIKLKIKAKGSSTYSAKTVTKVVKIKVK